MYTSYKIENRKFQLKFQEEAKATSDVKDFMRGLLRDVKHGLRTRNVHEIKYF